MSGGQDWASEVIKSTSAEWRVQRKLEAGSGCKWHDGTQWHTGNRLGFTDSCGRELVTSFGDVWCVPADWLKPVDLRSD